MTFSEVKASLPTPLGRLVEGYSWLDSSRGFTQTSTFRLDRQGEASRFLKVAPVSHWRELRTERDILEWLAGKLPVPEVLAFGENGDTEFLLASALPGSDAASLAPEILSRDIVRLLAIGMRMVHEIPIAECPFDRTLEVPSKSV